MNGKNKKGIIIAACLIVVGLLILFGTMKTKNFDFKKLDTQECETNIYELSGDFDKIKINELTSDIVFARSDDGACRIECVENKNLKHSAQVSNSTLEIRAADKAEWYDHIDVSVIKLKVTVYLPEDKYESITIKTSTGDIEIPAWLSVEKLAITGSTSDIDCRASVSDTIDVTVTTGDITLSDVSCGSLRAQSSTGDIRLKNTAASDFFALKSSTGGVLFDGCDAGSISVKTTTGDVTGTLLSEKIFITGTNTGDVSVPNTAGGGKCEITTVTGDIEIKIPG